MSLFWGVKVVSFSLYVKKDLVNTCTAFNSKKQGVDSSHYYHSHFGLQTKYTL